MNEVDLGDVFRTTFDVLKRRAGAALMCVAIIAVPSVLITLATSLYMMSVLDGMGAAPASANELDALLGVAKMLGPTALFSVAVFFVSYALAQGAMTIVAVDYVAGRETDRDAALRHTLNTTFPLLVSSLIASIGMCVGFVFCFLPGVFAALLFALILPAIVIEDLGPLAALERSMTLAQGNLGKLFVCLLAYVVLWIGLELVLVAPLELALGLTGDEITPARLVTETLSSLIDAAVAVFYATLLGVYYAKLVGIRDERSAAGVADVFA